MQIRVRLFAQCRDLAGADVVTIDLPEGGTVSDLMQAIGVSHPRLGEMTPHLKVAVNMEYAARDRTLHEQDEVALIPPVSGGAT